MTDTHATSDYPKTILDTPVATWVISLAILFSVVCFTIETLPGLSQGTIRFLEWSEAVVVGLFTFEYLYRLYKAPKKREFVFSFYGVIDLLAILPFYLALFIDLRSLRLLRLMRLLMLLKLVRYNKAVRRFGSAILGAKEELVIFTVASVIIFFIAALGIYHFEHQAQPEVFRSMFDSLWWAVVTLTTVGYGDMYPITTGGRVFTFAALMVGLGLVAVPTGIIAAALARLRHSEDQLENQLEMTGLPQGISLNQVTVAVRDMAESVSFYQRLGLVLIVDTPHYARFECPDGGVTFSLVLDPDAISSNTVVYFEHPHLDIWVEALQNRGFAFHQLPTDMSYLWREAVLHDPSGNKIKLYWAGENRRFPPWRVESQSQQS